MELTLCGIFVFIYISSHPSNACDAIVANLLGSDISFRLEQFLNALFDIFSTESQFSIDCKFTQSLNAKSPISVADLFRLIFVILDPRNAHL